MRAPHFSHTKFPDAKLHSSIYCPFYSIELKARWGRFPLKVLVAFNNWSNDEYAVSVREALDGWVTSIPAYVNLTNDATLRIMSFAFYVSTVNSTTNYDVLVTFAPDEIPPTSNAVGLTTIEWNSRTHTIVPPVIVNITTYSRTASNLFVRDVAMHELGYALGLGHASPQYTADGNPELMYRITSQSQIVYPSTLDLYGLTVLYKGNFAQSVQLPASIPYKMLIATTPPNQPVSLWEAYYREIVILSVLLLVSAVVLSINVRDKNRPRSVQEDFKAIYSL